MQKNNSPLRRMVYASMFGALTAIGAYLIIPLHPVPITFQTLFTYLAGILLGGYTGALSQIVYVLLGIIGLPVFAGGKAGLGVLLGPSGGFLIGFIIGAFVIGKMVEARKEPGFVWICLSILLGSIFIYIPGVIQLAMAAKLSFYKALLIGVVPYLPGDLLKMLAAAIISLKLRKNISI